MKKKITVTCPTCKKEFDYYESEFRPFCQEKCQLLDIGKWLDGEYKIPVTTPVNEFDQLDETSDNLKKSDDNDED